MTKETTNLPQDLPSDLLEKYRETETEFFRIYQTDPTRAFSIWKKLYKEVLSRQSEERRFHKGGEVHNMGISKLVLHSYGEAMKYFMLGFIEDVLSIQDESGNTPEQAPGALNLKNLFNFDQSDFDLIKEAIADVTRKKGVIQNPEDVIKKLSEYSNFQEIQLKAKKFASVIEWGKYSISRIDGDWEKRVFIGGDYLLRSYIIEVIKPVVLEQGYTPIIAGEFQTPKELTRRLALLLLHNCKYAIFDISTKGGHLMEIERTFDYETITLFVCEDSYMSSVSSMLITVKPNAERFNDTDELKEKVREFLKKGTGRNVH